LPSVSSQPDIAAPVTKPAVCARRHPIYDPYLPPISSFQATKPAAPTANGKLAQISKPKLSTAPANAKGAVVQPIRREASTTIVKRTASVSNASALAAKKKGPTQTQSTGRPGADVTNIAK